MHFPANPVMSVVSGTRVGSLVINSQDLHQQLPPVTSCGAKKMWERIFRGPLQQYVVGAPIE